MKVGIQLYSVRNHMAQDPIGTLKEVAKIGYRYIEVANHNAEVDNGVGFGVTPEEIRKVLEEENISIISAHIYPMDAAKILPVLEYHKQIGTRYIVMPMDFYRDRDETLRKAEILNQVGEKCAEYQMELLYHNHFHEFQKFEGETVYDLIMNNTDPKLVKIELDSYWTMRGQQNPLDLLNKFGSRVRLLHQKDFTRGYENQLDLLASVEENHDYVDMDRFLKGLSSETFTEIGTGIMDIQSIINTANSVCRSEYIILEQDYSRHDELESIRISMDSFRKFAGIEW